MSTIQGLVAPFRRSRQHLPFSDLRSHLRRLLPRKIAVYFIETESDEERREWFQVLPAT